jgi:hypothetical protein
MYARFPSRPGATSAPEGAWGHSSFDARRAAHLRTMTYAGAEDRPHSPGMPFDLRHVPLFPPATQAARAKAGDQAQPVQMKEAPSAAPPRADSFASPAVAARGVRDAGEALPHRSALETSFGVDLSHLRVHRGEGAQEACEAMGAHAYTLGGDIALRAEPHPWLLAHEVAHTIQQGATPRAPGGAASGSLESEADRAADATARGAPAKVAGVAREAGAQPLKMADADIKKLPRTAAYVRDEMPKTVNDSRLMKAVNDAGRNTGAKARDPKTDLAWGNIPSLSFVKLKSRVSGQHDPGSTVRQISQADVAALAK